MRLFHFIKGCKKESRFIGLLDNQRYIFSGLEVKNYRVHPSGKILFDEAPGKRTKAEHREDKIWRFLNEISRDVEVSLTDNISDALVLFNGEEYEHNTDDEFISISGTDTRSFTINTGNLIGSVTRGDYSLKISSRFGDAFLKYIISDADGFLELENIGGESHSGSYEWLLAYLWNIKFKRAYRLGLPKIYITKRERVSRVRGAIDPVDYFQHKTSGKYLCSYREHSYDSPATSLLIKAYETIENYGFCQDTRNIYNAFLTANQGVKRSHREILQTPYFDNPYYNDYNILIDLSKQIINQHGSDFDSQHESSAFLFDISMLFEYFIRKLLKKNGIFLLSKFDERHEIPTCAIATYRRKLEPDLVFDNDGGLYIFDVKYKSFDKRYGVKREDLFQLHTYIGQYGNSSLIKGCGFIYPISETKWNSLQLDESSGLISDLIQQQGKEIPFHVFFIKIPDNSSPNFNQLMSEQCNVFIKTLWSNIL